MFNLDTLRRVRSQTLCKLLILFLGNQVASVDQDTVNKGCKLLSVEISIPVVVKVLKDAHYLVLPTVGIRITVHDLNPIQKSRTILFTFRLSSHSSSSPSIALLSCPASTPQTPGRPTGCCSWTPY
mmetsp:Transcript_18648/g.29720  ORF Transcript_18648/g.29720 Transcript_18648/m.29720 type:complete len:126 (+) Transcript_18648:680-1057(+)